MALEPSSSYNLEDFVDMIDFRSVAVGIQEGEEIARIKYKKRLFIFPIIVCIFLLFGGVVFLASRERQLIKVERLRRKVINLEESKFAQLEQLGREIQELKRENQKLTVIVKETQEEVYQNNEATIDPRDVDYDAITALPPD